MHHYMHWFESFWSFLKNLTSVLPYVFPIQNHIVFKRCRKINSTPNEFFDSLQCLLLRVIMFFSYKKARKAIENLLSCWNFSRCCARWPKVDHWCLVAHLLCRYRAGTVQAPCNYCAGTVQALCKHRVNTVQNWNPKLNTA